MSAARLHRRLAVLLCLSALTAFAGGAGFEPLSTGLAGLALGAALLWQPSPGLSARLERLWLPLAVVLVGRAVLHLIVPDGDVVAPVVDLLLLLMCAEALRSLDAPNDDRLYALSFALMLASTAYRPGVLFAVAFAAYVVVGTVALTVGHVRRRALSRGRPDVPVDRRLVLATAALSGVVLVSGVAVFLAFPRVSRAWAGRGGTRGTSIAGFADEVSLAEFGSRIRANPEVVLRVEFPDGPPRHPGDLHWKGRSYDHFDGTRWSRSQRVRPSAGAVRWYRAWSDSVIRQRIYAEPLDVRVLFALHPVLDVEPASRIHPLVDVTGDYVYWGNSAPVYTVLSAAAPPPAEALRHAGTGFLPDPEHYLQLPGLPGRVAALADSLTRDLPTRYDKVKAVESWLRAEFEYTLELPATAARASLDHFLFERRAGHCEYFSTAMVVLLRSVGIESRNVNGFLGGRWSDLGAYLAVTQNEAHSWVEVWFPGFGWVPFDPTPPGAGAREAAGGWLWPGRFVFDALQHRWSTWVLDYDLESQSDILRRLLGGAGEPAAGAGRSTWSLLWLGLLGAVVAAGVVFLIRGGRPRLPPESRLYLRLVNACRRAGQAPPGAVTPLLLVADLRAAGHPAADPASRLVDRYLRARFAADPAGRDELARMTRDLQAARRRLRRTDPGGGRRPGPRNDRGRRPGRGPTEPTRTPRHPGFSR